MHNVERVVERLRKEWREDYAAGLEKGREDGSEWAADEATLAQLRHFAHAEQIEASEVEQLLDEGYIDNRCWDDYSRSAVFDREAYLSGYVEGFVRGAKATWDQVKDRL